MKALVNGVERELPDGVTIAQLLENMGAPKTGIAVARNDEVVRRSAHALEKITAGDRIEIIKAVAGG